MSASVTLVDWLEGSEMDRTVESIHVASFGWAIAESIRDALRLLGCKERVIGLRDNLSFGPINPPDGNLRHSWMKSVLLYDGSDDLRGDDPRDKENSWAEATAPDVFPVFWVCMSGAAEQANFLEFVSRMNGRPFDIIDATDLEFVTADGVERPWSLSLMRPSDIVASGLHMKRRAITHADVSKAAEVWSQLVVENAPLRIVRDGTLVSAPLTYFDTFLIDLATEEWEVAARLIGRTLTTMFYTEPRGQGPSDIVLFGRILALGEDGSLEISGPGPDMRNYKVRKANIRQSA